MTNAPSRTGILDDFSLEMTGKDVGGLENAAPLLPRGTRVNVTFLGNEDLPMRLAAAQSVLRLGFRPVPHISARRMSGDRELTEFLTALQQSGASRDVFAVGGDPHTPAGPYADALSIIRSGLLTRYGVQDVGISGYPEGHPDIPENALWAALADKAAALREQDLSGTIITQFGFDEAPVLRWIERVRDAGIALPIRIGVPGPAGVKRLLAFAKRFGVASSAGIARKYGLSLSNLMGTAGPDRLVDSLASGYDPERHGDVRLHFYTFGGLTATAEWLRDHGRR